MMGVSGSQLRQVGWVAIFAVCLALFMALTFSVNAVKSKVRLAERQIVALENEKAMLETEFQTRASQHQLAYWNAVEFGYAPPRADQYLADERALAAYGAKAMPGAPEPIRVAVGTGGEELPKLVSPLTGEPVELEREPVADGFDAGRFLDRLAAEGTATIVAMEGSE